MCSFNASACLTKEVCVCARARARVSCRLHMCAFRMRSLCGLSSCRTTRRLIAQLVGTLGRRGSFLQCDSQPWNNAQDKELG
mmetsp:Transcript_71774/g.191514  ORF Transcript_71774/g.191514 Transcript_71774/m.191514 type:complete len:82 (+) Transcript_71774:5293-5538(+)